MQIDVLDHGFVRLIDIMGDDAAICEAARNSYGKGTKSVSDDRTLIRYLMRHAHTTPFEMCEIKLQVKVPMDCWRQWIRHRTASVNEYSTRYSEAIDDKQTTPPNAWRLQSTANKQGSGTYINNDIGEILSHDERHFHVTANQLYRSRLDAGVAREQARKDLPLSTYTLAYWKIDLHNLLHFLKLRMHPHAQEEIRAYANVIGFDIVAHHFPLTWAAFLEYEFHAIKFSWSELNILRRAFENHVDFDIFKQDTVGWNKREAAEFLAKLQQVFDVSQAL